MANYISSRSGGIPPPKPWERARASSSSPFKPPSAGSTSDVVEASGTAIPGEIVPINNTTSVNAINRINSLGLPVSSRPWQQQQQVYRSIYGGYGVGNYGLYGGFGGMGMYNKGLYGNMYRGGGMYGMERMYNSSFGDPMGGSYGDQDPNSPFGASSSPPGFWSSLMRVMQGVATLFDRVATLIDQNTRASHELMSAILEVLESSGFFYGELARFVFRLLGVITKPKANQPCRPNMPHGSSTSRLHRPVLIAKRMVENVVRFYRWAFFVCIYSRYVSCALKKSKKPLQD